MPDKPISESGPHTAHALSTDCLICSYSSPVINSFLRRNIFELWVSTKSSKMSLSIGGIASLVVWYFRRSSL